MVKFHGRAIEGVNHTQFTVAKRNAIGIGESIIYFTASYTGIKWIFNL